MAITDSSHGGARQASRARFVSRLASPVVASAVALALVAASLCAGMTLAPAASAGAATPSAPTVTLGAAGTDGKNTVLAGEDATYTLTVANQTTSRWYNFGVRVVVPNGITFVPTSQLGTPVVYASGATITDSNVGSTTTVVPAGSQVWVWQDVSDLPAGATYSAAFRVTARQKAPGASVDADVTYFPVGSTISLSAAVYASDVATLAPLFGGSTGVRTTAASNATHASAAVPASAKVVAVHVVTAEPSPESELLRGVHNRTTVYTATVRNTTQGATNSVQLVEYLPAALEFLGCGGVDNSTEVEHVNSGRLTATPVVTSCVTATTVETVARTAANRGSFPAWMGADGARDGVYTKVTWNLGTLAAGASRAISYAAGIPLFANAMWTGTAPATAAPALAQASNLDNNTGASTRHGASGGPAIDGNTHTNSVGAAGVYAGIVRTAADRSSGDNEEETVFSMDLRILKSVDTSPTNAQPTAYTSADGTFRTGYIAKYTLDLRASEYTDASVVVVTDHVPNGLCPVLPAGTQVKVGDVEIPRVDGTVTRITGSATLPVECNLGSSSYQAGGWVAPTVSGAGVDWVAYDASNGDFYLRFSPIDVATTQASASIVYPVLMRQSYEKNEGLTSAQDRLTNTAVFTATSSTTVDATSRDSGIRIASIADDSQATLTSGPATISKKVLPRSTALAASAADPCAVTGYTPATQTGFVLGDTVCYELAVDFQPGADTRNPAVTDMLPPGVAYLGSAAYLTRNGSPVAFSSNVTEPATAGTRIVWTPSDKVSDGDRFVSRGSRLTIHVWGSVSTLSVSPATLDKPNNLMKFEQENVHGDVFFLRDEAAIEVSAGLSLVKGVARVNGSTTFVASTAGCSGTAPNCDHVRIKEGDAVAYRVDITGAPYPVTDLVIWDALPSGVTSSNVAASALYDVVDAPGVPAGYDGLAGRSVIVWKPFALAAGASTTLEYLVTMPGQITSGAAFTNTASIISYVVANNRGTTVFRPVGSLGTDVGNNVPGGTATRNDSDVYVPPATIAKSVVGTGISAAADPANGARATSGEQIDYSYSVTVPARTTVKGARLSDDGTLANNVSFTGAVAYTPIAGSATVTYPAGATAAPSAFTFDTTTGRLDFPAVYDNATDLDQKFTVNISVYTTAPWANGVTLYNRARFSAAGMTDLTTRASLVYAQPSPQVTKSVSSGAAKVTAGQEITFTLAANNDAGRPISYDTVITDCVPQQLSSVAYSGVPSQGSVLPPVVGSLLCGGTGTLLTWNLGDLAQGSANRTLAYTAVVDPTSAGGASYTNTARLVGHSLDGGVLAPRNLALTDESTVTVNIEEALVTKTVSPTAATIGQSVEYTVDVQLPKDVNFYAATITDPAPDGVRVTGPVTVVDAGTGLTCAVASGTIGCSVPTGSGDVLSAPAVRHVVLTYSGTVVSTAGAPVKGAKPRNTATFAWRTASGGTVGREVVGSADLTVTEPAVAIVKMVEGTDANTVATAVRIVPGQSRAYSIAVTNPAVPNASAAYGVVVVDDVPAGLVLDAASVTGGGVVTGGGRTITWTIDEILVGGAVNLAYSASLVASETFSPVASTLASTKNVASVTKYYSLGDATNPDRRAYLGGSDPAYVAPGFPHVTVAKATSGTDLAKVGTPLAWLVTLTNTGAAPAKSVTMTDALPENWRYTATTSVSRVHAGTTTAANPADYAFTASTLTWVVKNIPAGDSVVVVYTATPSVDSYETPGVGALRTVPHTNTAQITRVTDATDATGNAVDTEYRGDEATADAYLVATDVTVTKSRLGTGRINVGDLVDFTVTAKNVGAQAAEQVTIVDTLPAGLTFAPSRVATPVTPGSGFVCTTDGDAVLECVLGGGLAAGASASVVVRAFVLEVDAASASEDRVNAVDITTSTPETDTTNNHAEATITVFAPEVTIAKSGALAAGAVGAVGEVVRYTFTVTNPATGARLTGVTIADAMFPDVGDIVFDAWPSGVAGRLEAGQSVIAHADYALTQADIDAGYVRNLARVTATPPVGPNYSDSDTIDVSVPNTPSLALVKAGSLDSTTSLPPRKGDGVTYAFTITNTGNVTLSGVALSDPMPGLASVVYAPGFAGSLAPGAHVTATATYSLTQADVDAGTLDNTATVEGTSTVGTTVDDDDAATITLTAAPSIMLEKSATVDPAGSFFAGDTISYSFSVRNTGNVTLNAAAIDDPLIGLTPIVYVWTGAAGVLLPGESAKAGATYRMTQADLDRGFVVNSATGRATAPAGGSVDSPATVTVKLTPAPAIKLTMTAKFASNARGFAGDLLQYNYLVTNRGNVTLEGMDLVSELDGISAMTYGAWPRVAGTLAPGESVTATANYRLVASDILAGKVVNNTRVTALAMVDGVASSVADDGEIGAPVLTLLAATGFSVVLPVGVALFLLLTGAALLLANRRFGWGRQ